MFENSKWIGYASKNPGEDICTTPSPYIAKTFELHEKPTKAILNGKDDGLTVETYKVSYQHLCMGKEV